MAKEIRYHFYLKDKNSCTPTPINFVFNKGSFRKKKATGESIDPEFWDFEEETAIVSTSQTKVQNALSKKVRKNLGMLRLELDDLFDEYLGIEKLTPNHYEGYNVLEELYSKACDIIDGCINDEREKAKRSMMSPIEFFDEFIRMWGVRINPRTNNVPTKGTMYNYRNVLSRYKSYISDCNIKDSFTSFTDDFQYGFDEYMMEELELSPNSIAETHSLLKVMLKRAYEKGLLKDTSFLDWNTKPKKTKHPYLTNEELRLMLNLTITDEAKAANKIGDRSRILETRDLFYISAKTALRYSDVKRLNQAQWDIRGSGKSYLRIITQKTLASVAIPLSDEVIALYNKYDGHLPVAVDKSHYNDHIRLCAKLAGITTPTPCYVWEKGRQIPTIKPKYELISSHTGRRSFCTNTYLISKDTQGVMAISGHKSEESFLAYLQLSQEMHAERIQQYVNIEYPEDMEQKKKDTVKEALKEAIIEYRELMDMKNGKRHFENPYQAFTDIAYEKRAENELPEYITEYQKALVAEKMRSLREAWSPMGIILDESTIAKLSEQYLQQ